MTDPLSSPKLRIKSANEDLTRLNSGFNSFLHGNAYTKAIEPDIDGAHHLHKLKLIKALPDTLSHQCARITEDLRSALDQTGYAMAVAGGIASPKHAYFPFAGTAKEFTNVVAGRCKDLPPDITALFASYQAHKGGDQILWALNALCGGSKHRFIEPVAGVVGNQITVGPTTIRSGTIDFMVPKWDAEKNEIVLFRTGPNTHARTDVNVTCFVAFGKIEVVGGMPVIPVLNDLIKKVDGIVSATEIKARSLGLIA